MADTEAGSGQTETTSPTQEMFDLYDQYCHNDIDRRTFMDRLAKFAVGGVTVAMLAEALLAGHVDVGIVDIVVARPRSDLDIARRGRAVVDEVMAVVVLPRKARRHRCAKLAFALVGNQCQLAGQNIDELVLLRV